MDITNEASQYQLKCLDKHDVTVRPVITYSYLCGDGIWPIYRLVCNPSVTVAFLNWNVRQE